MPTESQTFGVSEERAKTIAQQQARENSLTLGSGFAPGFAG
jgi:hypothetical protein